MGKTMRNFFLPEQYRKAISDYGEEQVEELRLRVGFPPQLLLFGQRKPVILPFAPVRKEELEAILMAACGQSLYAAQETLREGFLSASDGTRIGVCGSAVVKDGKITAMKDFSSLCIRFAHEPNIQISHLPQDSALIAGPPGCGKTTMLRALIRSISETGQRVGVADERFEISGRGSVEGFSLGENTDILCACPKAKAMEILLRTMRPEWIAVDEITAQADIEAIRSLSYCGVKILATAHLQSPKDLERRPLYQELLRLGVFRELLLMDDEKNGRWEEFPC